MFVFFFAGLLSPARSNRQASMIRISEKMGFAIVLDVLKERPRDLFRTMKLNLIYLFTLEPVLHLGWP